MHLNTAPTDPDFAMFTDNFAGLSAGAGIRRVPMRDARIE
jgi:hypothetical protein